MMNYTEVKFSFQPFDSIYPELLSASLAEIGFDTFHNEGETLLAYTPSGTISNEEIEDVINAFFIPDIKITFETSEIEEHNWNEEWEKMHYEPIIINDLCAIHAPHHENIPSVRYDIIINPRMAFGSGTHETTSMLTEILLNKDLKGKKTLDMGCGTGILAISMSLSGAENVYAIDIDEKSVANTTENISLNNIKNIETILGDASAISRIGNPLNLIVANIHKNIIINDMHLYANALTPKGELLVSGFYTEDANDILASAKEYGLSLKQTYSKNNWCVLLLQAT